MLTCIDAARPRSSIHEHAAGSESLEARRASRGSTHGRLGWPVDCDQPRSRRSRAEGGRGIPRGVYRLRATKDADRWLRRMLPSHNR